MQNPYSVTVEASDRPDAVTMIQYGSCRGCANSAIFKYHVVETSPSVEYLGETTEEPSDQTLLGGADSHTLYFNNDPAQPGWVRLQSVLLTHQLDGPSFVVSLKIAGPNDASVRVTHDYNLIHIFPSLQDALMFVRSDLVSHLAGAPITNPLSSMVWSSKGTIEISAGIGGRSIGYKFLDTNPTQQAAIQAYIERVANAINPRRPPMYL